MTHDEVKDEFRMIISHALLGYDLDVKKEDWEFVFSECAKFFMKAALPDKEGWISVEDGVPDYYKNVLVYYGQGSIGTVAHRISDEEKTSLSDVYERKFDNGIWWDGADLFNPINDVTHWHSLPNPPINKKGEVK